MGHQYFCDLMEALAEPEPDGVAQRFAGVNAAQWRELGSSAKEEAIVHIQAAERGRQARKNTLGQGPAPGDSAKRLSTLQKAADNVHKRASIAKDRKEQAATALQAVAQGNIERDTAQKARAELPAAQTIQRIWRRFLTLKNTAEPNGSPSPGVSFTAMVRVITEKNRAWVAAFNDAAGASPEQGLDPQGFFTALSEVHPRLASDQLAALFEAYEDSCDQRTIDLRTFCKIAQAVAAGDEDAAEFADVSLQQWQALGAQEPHKDGDDFSV
jgi:hypothetical protein